MSLTTSVVTVCYNVAGTIAATVDSVRAQTWRPLECVVVDGGSKDGTQDVVKGYADIIGTVVSEPDCGVYDAILDFSPARVLPMAGDALSLAVMTIWTPVVLVMFSVLLEFLAYLAAMVGAVVLVFIILSGHWLGYWLIAVFFIAVFARAFEQRIALLD